MADCRFGALPYNWSLVLAFTEFDCRGGCLENLRYSHLGVIWLSIGLLRQVALNHHYLKKEIVELPEVKERIAKLLRQADSVAGTPEADAFNQRAFELLARYKVSESDVRAAMDDSFGDGTVGVELNFGGPRAYPAMRLFARVAHASHCRTVYSDLPGPPRVIVVDVFGRPSDIDRARFLQDCLEPQMLTEANRRFEMSSEGISFKKYIRHFSTGFGDRIRARIMDAEDAAVRATSTNPKSTALVLVTDDERAEAALMAKFPATKSKSSKVFSDSLNRARSEGIIAADSAIIPGEKVLA